MRTIGYYHQFFDDERDKDIHELKFGKLAMDERVKKLTNLLWYVPYLEEAKAKIQ